MQKLLFSPISSFSHAEVIIVFHFTFLPWRRFYSIFIRILLFRSCNSCSFCLPSMQKLLFLFVSVFLMQKLLFLFILCSSHGEVVILVHFIFLSCRSPCSCSLHIPPWRNSFSLPFHIILLQKLLVSFIAHSSRAKVLNLVHFTSLQCRSFYFRWFHLPPIHKGEVVIFFHATFLP